MLLKNDLDYRGCLHVSNFRSVTFRPFPPHKMAAESKEKYSEAEGESVFELEEQSYWYSLKSGVLAYAASLQLQCLLFIVGHVHEFGSSTAIGLLPTSIRRKLLLHLPVADILKLECTPVTANISMDDLWQALFNTRIPELKMYAPTPEKLEEEFKINFNWKEAYFQSFLNLMIDDRNRFYADCDCLYDHLIPDLLYGVYDFHNTSFEAYQCFDNDKIDNFHNLHRYTRQCPRFTTSCYNDKFTHPTIPYHEGYPSSVTIYDLLELFSYSKSTPFKVFDFNNSILNNIWIDGYLTLPNIKWLFSSVEGISVDYCEDTDKLHRILDLIFAKSTVKSMFIYGSFEVVSQYLIGSSYSCLKTLHIQIDDRSECEIAGQILDHQKELEEVNIVTWYIMEDESKTIIIKAICDLLWRPYVNTLILSHFGTGYIHYPSVLEHFYSSPYPVTLELDSISYSFAVPFQVNQAGSSKSLTFLRCSYSSEDPSSSLASSNLFFKNLTLSQNESSVYQSLAKMESIEVEKKFTLNFACHNRNISDICSLFSVVTAQQWDVDVHFGYPYDVDGRFDPYDSKVYDNIEIFTSALPNIKGTLCSLSMHELSSRNMLPLLSLLETVFSHLESTETAYFELKITYSKIDDETLKAIHYTWKKCGSMKLKKVNMTGNKFASNDICNHILSEMTIEYTL